MDSQKIESQVRTRFAPSPTGYMHIGGMRTALYAYCFAKQQGGKFLLRLEDTDIERQVDGAEEIIYSSLKSAGLIYDEGPDVGGDFGPYIQSQRKALYMPIAEQLIEQGDAYYCFCTKQRLQEMHLQGHTKYDKCCLQLDKAIARQRAKTEPFVIRQNIPTVGTSSFEDLIFGTIQVENKELEDNILIKNDGMPTYNFANVVDDYTMNITHVIRGVEYLSSTPKYNLLYDALGWKRPQYIHLQPVMRDSQHKLSKRKGDPSFEDFINQGYLKEAIINYIALLGWSGKEENEKYSLQELVHKFSLSGLSKSPSIFDVQKLKWLNSLYIKELDFDVFFALASPHIIPQIDSWNILNPDIKTLCSLLQSRCSVLTDVIDLTSFLKYEDFRSFDLNLFENKKQKTDVNLAKIVIPKLQLLLQQCFEQDNNLHDVLKDFAEQNDIKLAQVMWILRIAITGSAITPGGATDMVKVIGNDSVLSRLKIVLDRLL
ncbi:MAG: glutamate--tRNA ligase [Firmicutes bacterium]|nr:glutamate--tRNA ligase [Bacillota bacterium]MCL1953883.1 glutamate--tRNA ligase [Bacillota bacterium]